MNHGTENGRGQEKRGNQWGRGVRGVRALENDEPGTSIRPKAKPPGLQTSIPSPQEAYTFPTGSQRTDVGTPSAA